jgi:hypothetical protein
MNAVFHRSAPKKLRVYTGAIRIAQLRGIGDSPGIIGEDGAKCASRLRFCVFSPKKTGLHPGFRAIPFDFQLRLS